ncbi:hypothetical protein Tco_1391316 [Tanacetum coccineum]
MCGAMNKIEASQSEGEAMQCSSISTPAWTDGLCWFYCDASKSRFWCCALMQRAKDTGKNDNLIVEKGHLYGLQLSEDGVTSVSTSVAKDFGRRLKNVDAEEHQNQTRRIQLNFPYMTPVSLSVLQKIKGDDRDLTQLSQIVILDLCCTFGEGHIESSALKICGKSGWTWFQRLSDVGSSSSRWKSFNRGRDSILGTIQGLLIVRKPLDSHPHSTMTAYHAGDRELMTLIVDELQFSQDCSHVPISQGMVSALN